MKRILILCGGQSPEHEISIRSCKNILKAIDRRLFEIVVVGISQDGVWNVIDENDIPATIENKGYAVDIRPGSLESFWCQNKSLGKFDAVFPVLHGSCGEDGTIQGLLTLLKIPFVGCGVLSSAVAMDKDIAKRLLERSGINVSKWLLLTDKFSVPVFDEVQRKLTSTVFVKPANMGSSVGVQRVSKAGEWMQAVANAFSFDRKVLVEEQIIGRELECAVLGNEDPKATGVGEVNTKNFYSFDEKYSQGSSATTIIPAKVDEETLEKLKYTALEAYRALQCEGLARVDMFLTQEQKIYVNEVNTLPGFTNISMYPQLWKEEGLEYSSLLTKLINLAIEKK